ncbi:MAG: acetyl-CoA carboxylase [Acidiferrobacterales bacterium]|nr:acetyl-CoA carboxylase [Acidiferrobacterales bacterium]
MSTKQIISQLPGTFYRRPSPDQHFYKEEGDTVAVGETIGLIEVMKSFHEVKSDHDGKISKFLVDDEDAVMAGQPIADVN